MDHGDVYETVLNELKTTSPEVISLTLLHTYNNLHNLLAKSIPNHPLHESDSLCLHDADIEEFKENLVNQAHDIVKLRNDKVIDFKDLYIVILKEIYSIFIDGKILDEPYIRSPYDYPQCSEMITCEFDIPEDYLNLRLEEYQNPLKMKTLLHIYDFRS